ncbi:hypothetical protein QAD02_011212 [Eretmocerus hayati]|uniref:Uncharacterized protein n=1 Tax=Eretmocerus hayati TaxID=131215 RepID=A0ACC2NWA3_9HYME|nr:hypothetical protein QAD02_011212 [Eretmocerus hayati]
MTASCAIEAGRSDSCPSPQALFNLVKSTQWIKRNMITVDPDKLSNSLGRKLTDAEIKVLRCLEGLEVPDWYTENSKPRKILNYDQPIDYRLSQPPRWKTMRSKVTNSPKKSTSRPSSRNSPKSSPRKSCTEDASYYTSTMDSGYNEDCGRPRRQQPTSRSLPYSVASSSASSSEQSLAPIDSSSEADEERTPSPELVRSQNQRVVEVEIHKAPQPRKPISRSASRSNREAASRQLQDSSSDADESVPQSKSSLRRSTPGKARHTLPISEPIASVPLGRCHTFPRLSPSRKIENINIVFEKPWPPQEPATQQREQEDHQDDQQAADLLKSPDAGRTLYTTTKSICLHSPASFFTAEVDLGNRSPTDRFFESDKKSRALEAIVQTKRHLPADRSSFIQEKLSELERSVALSSSGSLRGSFYREDKSMTTGSYVKSVVSELERSFDSDPAESCSVPYRSSSGEDSSAEEAPSTSPLPAPTASSSVCCSNDDTKNQDDGFGDVYWIPVNPAMLPRTSSLLSGLGSSIKIGIYPPHVPHARNFHQEQ